MENKAWTENNKFSICFLSSMHPPEDKRVFTKEAVYIADKGYEVIHLAPSNTAEVYQKDGVFISTYKTLGTGIHFRLVRLPRLFFFAREIDADCYHCNEPDSWIAGIFLKIFTGKKVIFDVHEHYPSRVAENYFPRLFRPFVESVVIVFFKILSNFTDVLIYAKKSVAADFPKKKKSVFVLNYTPIKNRDLDTDIQKQKTNERITAVHLGLISRKRGWPEAVNALSRIKHDFILHIVGKFSDGSADDFSKKVEELGIKDKVICEGWMNYDDAFERLLAADIGLILFQPGIKNHEFALPHKLFDYMLAGLPVIAPIFAKEIAPIVENENCGVLVNTDDPLEISQAFEYLISNPEKRYEMGQNGRAAVIREYNWEAEAEKLIDMYSNLLGNPI